MSRARYADAGQAQRAALDRLAAVELTSKAHLKYALIVSDVIGRVGSWSKLVDQVRRREVAERFRVSEDTVGRALKWAADSGVISWAPGKPGQQWVLGLIAAPQLAQVEICGGGAPQDEAEVAATSEKVLREEELSPPPPADEPQVATGDVEERIDLELRKNWGGKLTDRQRQALVASAVGLLGRYSERQVTTGLTCDGRGVRNAHRALQARLRTPDRWFTRSTVGGAPCPREMFADGARLIDWAGAA